MFKFAFKIKGSKKTPLMMYTPVTHKGYMNNLGAVVGDLFPHSAVTKVYFQTYSTLAGSYLDKKGTTVYFIATSKEMVRHIVGEKCVPLHSDGIFLRKYATKRRMFEQLKSKKYKRNLVPSTLAYAGGEQK